MMVKSAQPGEEGGERPPPFALATIKSKVVVYAPAERADTGTPYFCSTPSFAVKSRIRKPKMRILIRPGILTLSCKFLK